MLRYPRETQNEPFWGSRLPALTISSWLYLQQLAVKHIQNPPLPPSPHTHNHTLFWWFLPLCNVHSGPRYMHVYETFSAMIIMNFICGIIKVLCHLCRWNGSLYHVSFINGCWERLEDIGCVMQLLAKQSAQTVTTTYTIVMQSRNCWWLREIERDFQVWVCMCGTGLQPVDDQSESPQYSCLVRLNSCTYITYWVNTTLHL